MSEQVTKADLARLEARVLNLVAIAWRDHVGDTTAFDKLLDYSADGATRALPPAAAAPRESEESYWNSKEYMRDAYRRLHEARVALTAERDEARAEVERRRDQVDSLHQQQDELCVIFGGHCQRRELVDRAKAALLTADIAVKRADEAEAKLKATASELESALSGFNRQAAEMSRAYMLLPTVCGSPMCFDGNNLTPHVSAVAEEFAGRTEQLRLERKRADKAEARLKALVEELRGCVYPIIHTILDRHAPKERDNG